MLKSIVLAVTILLAGCAPSAHLEVMHAILPGNSDVKASMKNRHLVGLVAWDEAWYDNVSVAWRSELYMQGVRKGWPAAGYRHVVIMHGEDNAMLWVERGKHLRPHVALVPDHLPPLKRFDAVEFRSVQAWNAVKGVAEGADINVVVNLLCLAPENATPRLVVKDPCITQLPAAWGSKVVGISESRTPYPTHYREYGMTFTPRYDVNTGAVLSNAPALPPRPVR
jgi:hypothetical protein